MKKHSLLLTLMVINLLNGMEGKKRNRTTYENDNKKNIVRKNPSRACKKEKIVWSSDEEQEDTFDSNQKYSDLDKSAFSDSPHYSNAKQKEIIPKITEDGNFLICACGYLTTKKRMDLIDMHLKTPHTAKRKCNRGTCKEIFISIGALTQHRQKMHPATTNDNSLACSLCKFKTKNPQSLKNHEKKPHDLDIICATCDKHFISKGAKRQHAIQKKHYGNLHECSCGYETASSKAMKKHKKRYKNHSS